MQEQRLPSLFFFGVWFLFTDRGGHMGNERSRCFVSFDAYPWTMIAAFLETGSSAKVPDKKKIK